MTQKRRILVTILAIIGLILTFDLIYIYMKANFLSGLPKSFCSVNGFIDCDGVAQTEKAFFLGVPLAIWGLILYLLFLFLSWVDVINKKINFKLFNVFKNPSSYIAAIGLFSFIISMSLAYISISVINKICIVCFATYFVNLFIALCAVKKNFFITDIKNTVLDFIAGVKEYTTLFLIAAVAAVGILGYLQRSLILAPSIKIQKSIEEFQKMKTNPYAVNANNLGNVDGDVSIFVYGDFMCPFCRVMNIMLHKLVKEDKGVAVYHVNFPLDEACNPTVTKRIHPGSCILAKYALAARNQGNYWGMVNGIYNNLPRDEKEILHIGEDIGLDSDKLFNDAHSNTVDKYLEDQVYRGINEKIFATPTVIIDNIPHAEMLPYFKLKELVKQSRQRHRQK